MNGIVIARGGEARVVTLSDRLRPPALVRGGLDPRPGRRVRRSARAAEQVAVQAVHALGLENGIAFPQLIAAPDGGVHVVEVAARIPGGQIQTSSGTPSVSTWSKSLLARHACEQRSTICRQRFQQPLGDPLPHGRARSAAAGRVVRVGSLESMLAAEGVVQAETYLQVGETISARQGRRRPSRLRDRHGRHDDRGACTRRGGFAAARRGDRGSDVRIRPGALPRPCSRPPEPAATTSRSSTRSHGRGRCSSATTSISRSTQPCSSASSRPKRRGGDVLPDDRSPSSTTLPVRRHRRRYCACATRAPRRAPCGLPTCSSTTGSTPCWRGTTPTWSMTAPFDGAANVMAPPYFAPGTYRSD